MNTLAHTTSATVFMLGAGGLFAIMLSSYFGRYPVIMYFQTLALACAIWSTAAQGFKSFQASRILFGFFSSIGLTVSFLSPSIVYFLAYHTYRAD